MKRVPSQENKTEQQAQKEMGGFPGCMGKNQGINSLGKSIEEVLNFLKRSRSIVYQQKEKRNINSCKLSFA